MKATEARRIDDEKRVQEEESARSAGEADDEKIRGLQAQRREIEEHRRDCEATEVRRIDDQKRIRKGEVREKKRGLEEKRPQWEATGKEIRMAEVNRSEEMWEVQERKMAEERVEGIRRDEGSRRWRS